MYSKITNPETGRKINTNSIMGKTILRRYLSVLSGGAAAAPSLLDNTLNKIMEFFDDAVAQGYDRALLGNCIIAGCDPDGDVRTCRDEIRSDVINHRNHDVGTTIQSYAYSRRKWINRIYECTTSMVAGPSLLDDTLDEIMGFFDDAVAQGYDRALLGNCIAGCDPDGDARTCRDVIRSDVVNQRRHDVGTAIQAYAYSRRKWKNRIDECTAGMVAGEPFVVLYPVIDDGR